MLANISELRYLARSNIRTVEGLEELIEDIRGKEELFTLDNSGLQNLKYKLPIIDYQSKNDVEKTCKNEVERLPKKSIPGVDKVVFFKIGE